MRMPGRRPTTGDQRFPTVSKDGPKAKDRSALFRSIALPVSTLLLVDGLAGGLAECGHE